MLKKILRSVTALASPSIPAYRPPSNCIEFLAQQNGGDHGFMLVSGFTISAQGEIMPITGVVDAMTLEVVAVIAGSVDMPDQMQDGAAMTAMASPLGRKASPPADLESQIAAFDKKMKDDGAPIGADAIERMKQSASGLDVVSDWRRVVERSSHDRRHALV